MAVNFAVIVDTALAPITKILNKAKSAISAPYSVGARSLAEKSWNR